MSYFENKEVDLYNEMVYLLKSNDFYAMPKQYTNSALDIHEIEKFPKARVEFGRYDTFWDLSKLQPITSLKDIQYEFGKLTFEFNTIEFKKEIIYIDNMDIYAKSKINNDEVILLTNKHMYPEFIREHDVITSTFRINLHPFKGEYGKR